jgi:plastocyanin
MVLSKATLYILCPSCLIFVWVARSSSRTSRGGIVAKIESGLPGSYRSVRGPLRWALDTVAVLALAAALNAGCEHSPQSPRDVSYKVRVREITVTTVPLLVRESQTVYPFLKSDFAKGGILEAKEVYAFVPNTITVVEGDTIRFTLVNPEDDTHTLNLPDLAVALPGQQVVHATYVAARAGIYPLLCNMPNHLPMMSGQLVVLAPSAVEGTASRSP